MQHLILIDASGFIFRAFHALPPMTNAQGTPVNAVYGFMNMVLKQLDGHSADAIGVVFDAGRITFRQDIYPLYKAHREETPSELIPQFALVRQACQALHLPMIECPGFEADDLIATYADAAATQGMKVTIIASDKDLMQLVGGSIEMYDPMKGRAIGVPQVVEKFGVMPSQVVDVQALAGDASDNIPGVPGIGPKTAAELIQQFGSVEALLDQAETIRQPKRREALITNREQALISKQLVQLRHDAPMPLALSELTVRQVDPVAARAFLTEMGFRSLLNRFANALEEVPSPVVASVLVLETSKSESIIRTEAELKTWWQTYGQGQEVAVVVFLEGTQVVGMAFASTKGVAYAPCGHISQSGDLFGRHELAPDQLSPAALTTLTDATQWITYDAKRLWHAWRTLGATPSGLADDILLMSYVSHGGPHELGDLAQRYDVAIPDSMPLKVSRALQPIETIATYGAGIAQAVLKLSERLQAELTGSIEQVYTTIEKPLVPVLGRMEQTGVLVDVTVLKRLSQQFHHRAQALEQQVYAAVGKVFNIGSPKQLEEVLREDLIRAGAKKGKSGQYSTDANVLDELVIQGHQAATLILEWRQLSKLISTYTDALVNEINPITGRVHTQFAMAVTNTGRLSSNSPNLQNIPIRTEDGKKIRTAFVAEPGNVLVSMDYSQIELRLLAHFADVPTVRQAFAEGVDIHTLTASQVFNVPLANITPDVRRQAKAINFGIIYGISPYGLARQLGIGNGEAAAIIQAYFKQYPGIQAYMDAMKAYAHQHGFVETLYGRRCFVPDIHSKNPARRQFAERQAINAPLQGSNADIIKLAMIKLDAEMPQQQPKAKLILQVHDELLFEVPQDQADVFVTWARPIMAGIAPKLRVPLVVDAKVGRSWGG